MTYETRTIGQDEILPWLECLTTGFLDRPNVPLIAEQLSPYWDFQRVWGAFDGPVVGTLRSWATELTVPGGGLVSASAIAAVTVRPTHRRRGILRQLMAAEHAAALARGEPISILYASEASIYGRFGYGVAVMPCSWTINTRSTTFVGAPDAGVDFLPIDQAGSDLLKNLFDQYRRTRHGEIRRRDFTFAMDIGLIELAWDGPWKGWVAVHRDENGEPDGFVRYGAETKWEHHEPRATINVQDLVALNDAAYDALWRFLAEIDLVATVQADRRSPDERLPWILTNRRAAHAVDLGDGMWVNLLDVPGALAARRYERAGDVVLEVIGGGATAARERIHLEAGPDGASCTATTRDPDLILHADALGAAYLGGSPLSNSVLPRGFEEVRAGALAEAEALFRTLDAPRCSTFF